MLDHFEPVHWGPEKRSARWVQDVLGGTDSVLGDMVNVAASRTQRPWAVCSLVSSPREPIGRAGMPVDDVVVDSFTSHCLTHGGLVDVADVRSHPVLESLHIGATPVGAVAGVPLDAPDGRRVGALWVAHERAATLIDRQRDRLLEVASSIQDLWALRCRGTRDDRTGLYEPQLMRRVLERACDPATTGSGWVSLVLASLDHATPDSEPTSVEVGKVIADVAASHGVGAGWWRGRSFAIALEGVEPDEAELVAAEVVIGVRAAALSHDAANRTASVSVGSSTITPGLKGDLITLEADAQAGLAASVRAGCNRWTRLPQQRPTALSA